MNIRSKNIRRVMLAAPKSGSGKTIATCALLWVLKENGWDPVSYKCGPDYIDPMFHEKMLHIPSENLDTFFTGEEGTRELFVRRAQGDFAVLEGVMGLYDGLGGVQEEGSSYHLAKVTKTPIILIVDAKGMGRSLLPLLAGFLAYDKEHLIRGVILNRISKGYYETIKPLIEQELHIQAAGFLPEQEAYRIGSRHLGLMLPDEYGDIQKRLGAAGEGFSKTVSLDAVIKIAESAEELVCGGKAGAWKQEPVRAVIAAAKDEAFCFYYKDNIRLLEAYGAQIRYFSPLRDEKLPEGCHGLLLGGGYPELYAEQLSENRRMLGAVRDAVERGMPVVAECGGFMYLHDTLTDASGKSYAMAGVLSASCSYTGKLVRFGYVELREKQSSFLPEGACIKGHEFHYYDSTQNGTGVTAKKPAAGTEYSCIQTDADRWMGFPHLYYPSNPAFAQSFVDKAEKYKERMSGAAMEHSSRFFENRACEYFPCHKGVKQLNCLFCYCPFYSREHCPGNPGYMEREGKKIKICTDCIFPHQPGNYDKIIQALKI